MTPTDVAVMSGGLVHVEAGSTDAGLEEGVENGAQGAHYGERRVYESDASAVFICEVEILAPILFRLIVYTIQRLWQN